MKRALLIVVVIVIAGATGTRGQSTFGLWSASELRQREQALTTHVAADHSSRETLADYGDHRFRLLYRDADGNPEQHDQIVDVVIVQSGEGTLVLGGTMIGKRAGGGAGEYLGTSLEGGERHPLGPGDVVHIPATIPHSFLVPRGKHLTYVLVKFPAR
jgi:mannose-6-phosphate isomerase-like protein (cupin superfamily)